MAPQWGVKFTRLPEKLQYEREPKTFNCRKQPSSHYSEGIFHTVAVTNQFPRALYITKGPVQVRTSCINSSHSFFFVDIWWHIEKKSNIL